MFKGKGRCIAWLIDNTIGLINRYEEENERLKQIANFTPARHSGKSPFLNMVLDNVRAEAIKEFAERLKEESEHFWEEKENFVSEEQIDNLLKEMGVE